LVGITNAFNLIDSMDGIVAGLSTLASAFFIFLTSTSAQPQLAIWAAILTGISLALYFWNSPPARYFLGDSGAQTLGFLLAVLALLYNPLNKDQASSWFVPILILGVPIFDTSLVVFSRLRRHRPPFEGNRDHTYHRLVRGGMNSSRAVSLIHIIALSLDSIALFALSQIPLLANSIFATCLFTGAGLIYMFDFSEKFISPPKVVVKEMK
jgi:UDP-GlcNAc:undecaprenyl-phosphate GlcNAc-1-phosphate transferase